MRGQITNGIGKDFASLRFLLVEDNGYTQKLLAEVMKAFGVSAEKIRMASDGSSALAILKDHPIDVVVTDALMEPVDGIALTKAIRSSKRKAIRDVPIVLCTGYSEKHRVAEVRDAGIMGTVVKLFSVHTLHERICVAIEIRAPIFSPNSSAALVDGGKPKRSMSRSVEMRTEGMS